MLYLVKFVWLLQMLNIVASESNTLNTFIAKNYVDGPSFLNSVQFRSVAQSCLILCNPMDFTVHHQLLELTQTPVHRHDGHPTISSFSSHLWSFPASGSFPMSQYFNHVAKVLEFQLQHQSFQWIFRTDFFEDGPVGSPCSLRDSQESPPTPQFKSINFSAFSFLYSPTLTSIHDYWKNHSFD